MTDCEILRQLLETRDQPIVKFKIVSQSKKVRGVLMRKVACKEIAYYGKPIETLTRDELIRCIEELAGAIYDYASQGRTCSDVIKIKTLECVS